MRTYATNRLNVAAVLHALGYAWAGFEPNAWGWHCYQFMDPGDHCREIERLYEAGYLSVPAQVLFRSVQYLRGELHARLEAPAK